MGGSTIIRLAVHLIKWMDGFGSAEPTSNFFLFLAMELPQSVQQLLCHQFDLAPTLKALIIYRDYCRGLMLVFNVFHCDLKYIYEQLSTSLHDAFEWAATKILAPLDVGLCSLGIATP